MHLGMVENSSTFRRFSVVQLRCATFTQAFGTVLMSMMDPIKDAVVKISVYYSDFMQPFERPLQWTESFVLFTSGSTWYIIVICTVWELVLLLFIKYYDQLDLCWKHVLETEFFFSSGSWEPCCGLYFCYTTLNMANWWHSFKSALNISNEFWQITLQTHPFTLHWFTIWLTIQFTNYPTLHPIHH